MKNRDVNTVLLITRDRLARADVRTSRKERVVTVRAEPRPAVDDFPSLVETALRLSGSRPGRVWVLSTEFWTQTLSLPPETTAGVASDRLARALGFEAEPFSGISALESTVGHVPLSGRGGERSFWLIQVPTALLEQVEYVVEQGGGKLAGLSHPGGLPRPLSGPTARAGGATGWRRVELWPGAMVCVRGERGREPAVHVRNTDPRPGRWKPDVERWLAEEPSDLHTEFLFAASGLARADVPFETCTDIGDAGSLQRFLEAWADVLSRGEDPVPAVCPPKRPLSASSRRMLAAAAALVVGILCLGHYLLSQYHCRTLVERTADLTRPAGKLAQLQKQAETLKKERATLKADCDKLGADLAQCRRATTAQRQRVAALLTVLAQQGCEQMLIRKIDGTEDEIVLHGVCLEQSLADGLAGALERTVSPLGWQVQLVDKRSKELLAAGGPWEFDVCVKDQGLVRHEAGAPAAGAIEKRRGR